MQRSASKATRAVSPKLIFMDWILKEEGKPGVALAATNQTAMTQQPSSH